MRMLAAVVAAAIFVFAAVMLFAATSHAQVDMRTLEPPISTEAKPPDQAEAKPPDPAGEKYVCPGAGYYDNAHVCCCINSAVGRYCLRHSGGQQCSDACPAAPAC